MNGSHLKEGMENSVYDLALYEDQLFVPDYRNNKLLVLELPEGVVFAKYDVPMPHGVAVDINGKIYISTYKQNSICIIEDDISIYKHNIHFNHPVSISIKDDCTIIANYGGDNSGNVIISDDDFKSFDQFTDEWLDSKPHAVRVNTQNEVLVAYRNAPGLVMYDFNGKIKRQKKLSNNFDPLSIHEYQSYYLVPNSIDRRIYIFDNFLNYISDFDGGEYLPTNLLIWKDSIIVSEEEANRISIFKLDNLYNTLKKN